MEKLNELLCLLEERLVQHDNNRKEVQRKLQEVCSKTLEEADSFEDKTIDKISSAFDKAEERILEIIDKLNQGDESELGPLTKKAQEELSIEQKCTVEYSEWGESLDDSYKFDVVPHEVCKEIDFSGISDTTAKFELIISMLQGHLDKDHESKVAAQEKIVGICNEKRGEADELEKKINSELELVFDKEDARLQRIVKEISECIGTASPDEFKGLALKAKAALVENQRYALDELSEWATERLSDNYNLVVAKEMSLKYFNFGERKPMEFAVSLTKKGELSLSFAFFDEDEVGVLKDVDLSLYVKVKVWGKDRGEDTSRTFTRELTLGNDKPICFIGTFTENSTYCLKMKIECCDLCSQWSDEAEFTASGFEECCIWKECPSDAYWGWKYSVDEENPRIATKSNNGDCIVTGNMSLSLSKVTSWRIKILKSKWNNGGDIYIGVAPSDINHNYNNMNGWYFDCYRSTLLSGAPHNYRDKVYGPKKRDGEYVHTGDSVGVAMDTAKGEVSFVLDGVNLGVAYEGIPLDKPLVPCVLLRYEGDSVELVI